MNRRVVCPADTATLRSQPLRGMRIIELSSYVASPLSGMTLAQLGADVIRVEPIGGGPDRTRWPLAESGTSLYWAGLNKGKRAIEVDLSTADGRRLVSDLIAGAGTVISNSERYPELAFEALRARRPDVIHVLLTGRRDGSTAVDYTVQAATGFPLLTGPENTTGPVNSPVPAWDLAAGLYLAIGLLAAERHRLLTGEGQSLRVALEDVALAAAGNLGYLAEAQLNGTSRERDGNHVYGTFGRDFATADGERLMIVALTARHAEDLFAATGLTGVVSALSAALGADFDEEAERYRHRKVLGELLAGWFETHTLAEAEEALRATRVLWSPYRSFTDLVADDARLLRESPLMAELRQPGAGEHWAPGSPLVLDGEQSPPAAAPLVGQHTEEVLRDELGLSAPDLAKLRENGVIPPGGDRDGEGSP
ncbi:CoA transferase [Actinomadura rudentiformis]|uniref:2-methylfumaryl-CoA isomerase n=1 Tax=Actinomadura rudentiformis TaxID=359158 RepID=A0A6H9YJL3_9ACTN|nr:CoA transferase [Actinomadura rudentiformis]KAB2344467.1 2-methylfumaryl-CoA isomerase [Actinomadura rudentiformis]